MTGLILRLAGPLQSWGERSAFSAVRDTAAFPTRSGLTGILAAAEGLPRGAALDGYDELQFTVRIDRPGILLSDYHTVGGGYPARLTAATSGGQNKGAAVVTSRHYLADAVFVVAVTGPERRIADIATALRHPHWAPYLGRRSCVPDEPLLLRPHAADPVTELLTLTPLTSPYTDDRLRQPQPAGRSVPVEFLWEQPPSDNRDAVQLTSHDHPVDFSAQQRAHRKRHIYRTVEHLPAHLLEHGGERTVHERLIEYALQPTASPLRTETTT